MIRNNQEINVFQLVNRLREQRVLMVQKFVRCRLNNNFFKKKLFSTLKEQYSLVHAALIENYLFNDSLMKKPNYSDDFYKKLCGNKDPLTKKPLIEIQFERIGEFDEKVRTTTIADSNPEIFKSPFKPCNYIIPPFFHSVLFLS
jgi:hypothetical protein